MKERPILFNGPMVRALLDGSKSQTRRAVKPQPSPSSTEAFQGMDGIWRFSHPTARCPVSHEADDVRCPYGQSGDRLWVRETTHRRPMLQLLTGEPLDPKYDGGAYTADSNDVLNPDGFDFSWWYSRKTCPAIHMPRWASRILLEIVSVRVERLQDISEADALAEGVDPNSVASFARVTGVTRPAGFAYRDLWSRTNGPGSWDANPWVWIVVFKRVTPC